ncbi:thiazole tautomerase TenI [Planococcus sp. SIMBA_160]
MRNGELHIVSTGQQKPERLAEILGEIHFDVDFIHLREKAKTAKELYELVGLLVREKIPLSKIIINDRVDVALVSDVNGVHLASHSLPAAVVGRKFSHLKIGCSVHSFEEAQLAEQKGADYLFFGHVYPTSSKEGLKPKGIEQLGFISESVSIPVIAIGGIKPSNTAKLIEAGAQGIAVMTGVLKAEDPVQAVQRYRSFLSKAMNSDKG